LTATARLARVRDADEAIELISHGLLGVSAGFLVGRDGQRWTGNRRLITAADLDHVAFTPDPAHEAAAILNVRDRELLAR